jgi:hypothetical protein
MKYNYIDMGLRRVECLESRLTMRCFCEWIDREELTLKIRRK